MLSRPAQLQRLLWLYHAFNGAEDGTIPASTLDGQYKAWKVERKTAVRDRKIFEGWGGEGCLHYDKSRRVWRLKQRFDLPEDLAALQPLPQSQGLLVSVARDVLRSSQGPASLVNSVLDGMDDEPTPNISVFAAPRAGRDSKRISALWLQLHEAITAKVRVELVRKVKAPVCVEPLHLWWAQGGWYLLARDPGTKELRNHSLARFEDVHLTKARVGRVPDFDPKTWLGNGDWLYRGGPTKTARIRFEPAAVASFRDRIWQSDVVWKELKDGSAYILHPYPGRIHGEWEMARRILGWGEFCTIEGPASLLRTMNKLLIDISNRYKAPTSP